MHCSSFLIHVLNIDHDMPCWIQGHVYTHTVKYKDHEILDIKANN